MQCCAVQCYKMSWRSHRYEFFLLLCMGRSVTRLPASARATVETLSPQPRGGAGNPSTAVNYANAMNRALLPGVVQAVGVAVLVPVPARSRGHALCLLARARSPSVHLAKAATTGETLSPFHPSRVYIVPSWRVVLLTMRASTGTRLGWTPPRLVRRV